MPKNKYRVLERPDGYWEAHVRLWWFPLVWWNIRFEGYYMWHSRADAELECRAHANPGVTHKVEV